MVEDHVGGMRASLAHLAVMLADGDARRIRLDDEGRHPAGALVGRIGARHQGEHAGMRRIGDEALGAVDDVMTALAFGAGPDARSEEHTSELQSLMRISYAVFCLKKKKRRKQR